MLFRNDRGFGPVAALVVGRAADVFTGLETIGLWDRAGLLGILAKVSVSDGRKLTAAKERRLYAIAGGNLQMVLIAYSTMESPSAALILGAGYVGGQIGSFERFTHGKEANEFAGTQWDQTWEVAVTAVYVGLGIVECQVAFDILNHPRIS